MVDKLTNARRRLHKKRDNFNCADAVSRIASEIAAKAASEARNNIQCCRCDLHNQICSAKQQMADKAAEAARSAQSNLASKLALVNELSEEKQTVRCILHELTMSKKQLEEAINKEIESIAAEATLKGLLDKALLLASEVAVNADIVVSNIASDIKSIDKLLALESKECNLLCRKEHCARIDAETTKLAEKKAVLAATNAKNNVLKIKRQKPSFFET